MPVLIDHGDGPVEIGEGRGDLRLTSAPFPQFDGSQPSPRWGAFADGRPVSFARIYAEQPWVGIAVNRMMWWAIRVPLKLYRRTDSDGGRVRVRRDEHPLAEAIQQPAPREPQAALTLGMLGPLLVHGNALEGVEQGARNALRFQGVDWRIVNPIFLDPEDPAGEIVGWKINRPGVEDVRSVENTLHLRWWSPLGPLGVSPLSQIQSTLTLESQAIDWSVTNLQNAARPSGAVEMAEEAMALRPDERRKLYEQAVADFRENYGGTLKAGTLPVMPPGMKWTTTQHTTAVEAELMAQRMVNRNEVAAIYMIPPPMIGQLERSTFNNITTLRELAYTDGLAPPLILIEQYLNSHVVEGLLDEKDLFLEFDFGLILRGDRLKEIQALREGIGSALYTPNEGRAALNMPRVEVEGADQLWLNQNNQKPLGAAPAANPTEGTPA